LASSLTTTMTTNNKNKTTITITITTSSTTPAGYCPHCISDLNPPQIHDCLFLRLPAPPTIEQLFLILQQRPPPSAAAAVTANPIACLHSFSCHNADHAHPLISSPKRRCWTYYYYCYQRGISGAINQTPLLYEVLLPVVVLLLKLWMQ
jgi:hypothetical protein